MQPTKATQRAYLATRILDTPLWAIFNMLPLILLKGLNANSFELAIYLAIKPIVAVFAFYWSTFVGERPDGLRMNIMMARVLGLALFLMFPFVENVWFMIFSAAVYMTLAAGVVPAWMEILKQNLSDVQSKQTFAWGSAMGYLGGAIFPILFAWLLDSWLDAWRWIFPVAALISLTAIAFQVYIPLNLNKLSVDPPSGLKFRTFINPWVTSWKLLNEKRDFTKYQSAFMIVGAALMLIQPALYIFFDEQLSLSYLEFAVALSLCKGIAYALASPLWARLMSKIDIYRFSGFVAVLASLFPVMMLFSSWYFLWLYLAYIFYGIVQAGSELSWNMSGPIFAKGGDSAPYTRVNVFFVGIRGMIFPLLGSFLCTLTGSFSVLLLGAFFLLSASWVFLFYSSEYQHHKLQIDIPIKPHL